jgi:preprotein translocase subunit SecF
MIDAKFINPPDLDVLRVDINDLSLGSIEIQEFGTPDNILIKIEKQPGDESKQLEAIKKVKEILPENVDYRRIEYVGPKVGKELKIMGLKAVFFSLLAMFIYIWFRFDGWQFGLGAVIAVIHDVITTIGFFAITQIEFNLASIAAILTIAGYSINDTVVVFDRIRENITKVNNLDFSKLLNKSINETLSRTIMTSLTTLIALIALIVLGGKVISGFIIAMIWGVLIGTYSSIFIAASLISLLGYKSKNNK